MIWRWARALCSLLNRTGRRLCTDSLRLPLRLTILPPLRYVPPQLPASMDFQYRDPEKGFDRERVKGVVAKLVRVQDPAAATALEVVAGGRLYQVRARLSREERRAARQLVVARPCLSSYRHQLAVQSAVGILTAVST